MPPAGGEANRPGPDELLLLELLLELPLDDPDIADGDDEPDIPGEPDVNAPEPEPDPLVLETCPPAASGATTFVSP